VIGGGRRISRGRRRPADPRLAPTTRSGVAASRSPRTGRRTHVLSGDRPMIASAEVL